jgi:hypothetical protein
VGQAAQEERAVAPEVAPPAAEEVVPPPRPREPIVADLEHVARVWPQVVAEIEQQHARVHGFLQGSEVTQVADDHIAIAVSGVFMRLLDQPDERALIEGALSDFAGRSFSVRFVEISPTTHATPEPPPTLDHAALMEELKRTFNATEEPH